MAKWYFFNEQDEKLGPIRGRELVKYVEQGTVTPETWVEDENGQKVKAKHVKGLPFPERANGTMNQAENWNDSDFAKLRNDFDQMQQQEQTKISSDVAAAPVGQNPFTGALPAGANPFTAAVPPSSVPPSPFVQTPFSQTAQTAPPPVLAFCTNCGQPVAEQAATCMSCGAKPAGHKKCCRYCGTAINPAQVLCTVCGASINTKTTFALNLDFQKIRNNARLAIIAVVAFLILAVSGYYYLTDLLDKDKRTARRDLREIYALFQQETQKGMSNPQSLEDIDPQNFFPDMEGIMKSFAQKKSANLASWEKAVEKHCHEGEVLLGISGIFDLDILENENRAFEYGSGVTRAKLEVKVSEAVEWFHKSAEGGNAIGQFLYALCTANGFGAPQSSEESLKWIREAAEGGLLEAQMLLAATYAQGATDVHVPQDTVEAVKWLRKAAAQSDQPLVQCALGMIYFEGKDNVPKDESEAVKWFRKAAKKEFTEAQGMLGKCYYEGLGVSKNEKEAVEWLTKASDKEHTESQWLLGLCYLNGQGGLKVEKTKGIGLIIQAAEKGNIEAAYQLAVCYREGNGVSKDLQEALRWARLARNDGEQTELEKQILTELN